MRVFPVRSNEKSHLHGQFQDESTDQIQESLNPNHKQPHKLNESNTRFRSLADSHGLRTAPRPPSPSPPVNTRHIHTNSHSSHTSNPSLPLSGSDDGFSQSRTQRDADFHHSRGFFYRKRGIEFIFSLIC